MDYIREVTAQIQLNSGITAGVECTDIIYIELKC